MGMVVGSTALASDPSLTVQGSGDVPQMLADEAVENEIADLPAPEAIEPISIATPTQLAQVASVSDLSDVLPSDWAYTALQNLVETYGCIEGYPNRTFRGNQALTRYEFAAGLNACLDVIAGLITGDGLDGSTLATIQRLQQEFQAELATLRGRVDALEAETAQLRAQQFSTTTKLRGQVDANLVVPFGDRQLAAGGPQIDNFTTFTSRARLNFDTSFTGRDRLRTRLQARDELGGNNRVLGAGGLLANGGTGDFSISVSQLSYRFPIGSRVTAILAAEGIAREDFVTSTIVPFHGSSVSDAGKPQLYPFDMGGGGGFAGGLSFRLTNSLVFDAGYSSSRGGAPLGGSNNPNAGGIFGANSQSYIAQLSFLPDSFFKGALVYSRGNSGPDQIFTSTYGALASLDFGRFILAGYFAHHDEAGTPRSTDSWQIGVAFPDLFLEGSQLGIYYASLPSYNARPYMVEGYYSIPVSRNLTLTPALIYGDLDRNATFDRNNFYGALRATFTF
ncbi:iron uptake porin [Leptolyngbya sp. PCC 6406]|uniref:iron uptake porin n=1 Tax=Leptolyngbya sp. PCC 6406 TaxID=1173264 RepID=UPI001CEDFE9F|nr:iron uptake porin [Leptolyngbya sp. PCC 6406]